MTTYPDVLISEVGPRDGLQSVKGIVAPGYADPGVFAMYRA